MNLNDDELKIKNCGPNGKTCYGKKIGETIVNRTKDRRGKELRLYQCSLCNYWHLTHQIYGKSYFKIKKRIKRKR